MLMQPGELQLDTVSQAEISPLLVAHERFCASLGGARLRLVRRRLDGLELANRNLSEADLSGSSLTGANLPGARLVRANLYCADLRGANLHAARLTRADLRGACFRGANLSHAVLDEADLRAARMMVVMEGEARLLDRSGGSPGQPSSDGVDFSYCSLKNVSFGSAKLENANFSGALLDGVKFKGAHLVNVRFDDAVLTRTDVAELGLPAEAFKGCVFDVTPQAAVRAGMLKELLIAHENWVMPYAAEGAPAAVDGEDLRPLKDFPAGRKLAGLSARNAIAIEVGFAGGGLQAVKFDGADLRGADFSDCDLRGASFRGAKLTHASFRGARLGGLKLSGGRELVTDLCGASLSTAQFLEAGLDRPLTLMGVTPGDCDSDICLV